MRQRKKITKDRKIARLVDGTNSLSRSFVDRDTTLGDTKTVFPSMHADEERTILLPISCEVCGLTFGLIATKDGKVPSGYCPDHKGTGELLEKGFKKI